MNSRPSSPINPRMLELIQRLEELQECRVVAKAKEWVGVHLGALIETRLRML